MSNRHTTTLDLHTENDLLREQLAKAERELAALRALHEQDVSQPTSTEPTSQVHDLLQAIFDGLEDGLLLIDQAGVVRIVNRTLAKWLGSTPKKLVGQPWSVLYPRIAPDFPSHLGLQASGGKRSSYQHTRHRNLDGGIRILNVHTIALSGDPQSTGQMIVHVVDVTEPVQLQTQVIANERFAANGRLAASVAHEINTPLQSIQTALELLRIAAPDRREVYLAHALHETQRVAHIARQLLDLYHPVPATSGAVAINALIEQLLLLMNKRLTDQRVIVVRELAADLPPVWGRSDELMQVLLNLINNATEAMPDGGTLRVETTLAPNTELSNISQAVQIAVIDTGCGISPLLQMHIFEPFVTGKENGTGLGLSISKQIIEQHRGTIAVVSQVGVGSTFTVTLPCSAAALAEEV